MRYAKTIIVAGGALLVIGTTARAMSVAPSPMVHIASTAAGIMHKLDAVRASALEKGCLADPGKESPVCNAAAQEIQTLHDAAGTALDALKARPESARVAAATRIREFTGQNDLQLRYRATVANPYRDDKASMETYVDDRDNEYWIDPATDVIVQVGPVSGRHQATSQIGSRERKSVAELRKKATDFVSAQLPDFAKRKAALHPLEDNKGKEIYFFRWDDFSLPVQESRMPPFVQVALRADGSLASYTNTLTR